MKVFLVYVNDENFYRLLPEDLGGSRPGDPRVKVMGFPPLGIETLAPVLRQHGHEVRMFDTCHPEMKESDVVQALWDDPDRIERYMRLFEKDDIKKLETGVKVFIEKDEWQLLP